MSLPCICVRVYVKRVMQETVSLTIVSSESRFFKGKKPFKFEEIIRLVSVIVTLNCESIGLINFVFYSKKKLYYGLLLSDKLCLLIMFFYR